MVTVESVAREVGCPVRVVMRAAFLAGADFTERFDGAACIPADIARTIAARLSAGRGRTHHVGTKHNDTRRHPHRRP